MSEKVNNLSAGQGLSPGERSGLADQEPRNGSGGGSCTTLALTQRELSALFYSPIAYVVGFVFLLLTGWYFVGETLAPGSEAGMRLLFERMAAVLVFALPLLTMRSVADEFATGGIETLMTAPVTDGSVIMGKFFGTMWFYGVLLATTLVHVGILAQVTHPMWETILVGYLGMILLGALFIAVGLFASCCTKHQLLAAIIAVAILSLFTFVADYGAAYAPQAWQRNVFSYLNIMGHFGDFTKGILDSSSFIFLLSGTFFFLFLAVKVLESRRWR